MLVSSTHRASDSSQNSNLISIQYSHWKSSHSLKGSEGKLWKYWILMSSCESSVLFTVSFRETGMHYPLKQCNRWQHTHWYGSSPSVNKVAAAPSLNKFDSHKPSESTLVNNSLLCHKNKRHCASFASTLAPFKSKSNSDMQCSHMNNK